MSKLEAIVIYWVHEKELMADGHGRLLDFGAMLVWCKHEMEEKSGLICTSVSRTRTTSRAGNGPMKLQREKQDKCREVIETLQNNFVAKHVSFSDRHGKLAG